MAADRLLGADFARASACLAVLAHHLAQRLDPNILPAAARPFYFIMLKGAFGVSVFFVLSGFLLARPLWLALDSGSATCLQADVDALVEFEFDGVVAVLCSLVGCEALRDGSFDFASGNLVDVNRFGDVGFSGAGRDGVEAVFVAAA